MTIKIGDKIRMSERGENVSIPTSYVPLGTIGEVIEIYPDANPDGTIVTVKFEGCEYVDWAYPLEDAIADKVLNETTDIVKAKNRYPVIWAGIDKKSGEPTCVSITRKDARCSLDSGSKVVKYVAEADSKSFLTVQGDTIWVVLNKYNNYFIDPDEVCAHCTRVEAREDASEMGDAKVVKYVAIKS